jgi:hypothetical protein
MRPVRGQAEAPRVRERRAGDRARQGKPSRSKQPTTGRTPLVSIHRRSASATTTAAGGGARTAETAFSNHSCMRHHDAAVTERRDSSSKG